MDIRFPSRARLLRASLSLLLVTPATLGTVGGCSSEPAKPDPSGATTVPAFNRGVPSGTAEGPSNGSGSVSGSGGSRSTSTSESPVGNAGTALDTGAVNGGATSSGGPVAAAPCEDAPPPFDPEWPEATCESWAFESDACGEDWFRNYCSVSCGRCTPTNGSGPPMPPDCSGENLPNVSGGAGFATRYWDCCQPACAQNGGHKCSQDGVTQTGDNSSACVGGGAFACYDDAPREVSNCLAYGHIAKANPNCGGCFRIQFTGTGNSNPNDIGSKLIQGKQMIVKVTNTGSDVAGNQFDLMIPGGGVGMFNACTRQWNLNDLGEQFGGFLPDCTMGTHADKKECVRQKCMTLPAGNARNGCIFFVDWFQIADNPNFNFEATNCPF